MFREGSQIGQYTLIRRLGRGGFGEVWLAEKRSQFVTKRVAVKLPHEDQINFDSIHQEATLWEEASGHPNVLPIIDADIYDGQVVIVSEYAGGGSLADKLKAEGRLPLRQAVEMTIGVLSGLDFLHRKKIIHRDIKPQNILLQDGAPRLADFGISRAMQTTAVSSTIVGTDAYMAPESFEGKRNVGTDIWSVGVVLYQLLKGSLPFSQEHPSERMFAVLTREFAPLPDDVSPDLKIIVQKALAKNPQERYQSAAEMRENLQRALVSINYPTAAPTELLRHPPSAPIIQPPIPSPPTQSAPPGETNHHSIQTHIQPSPPEKETEQYTHPVVETPSFSAPTSVVTQIGQPLTNEISKPLPTVAHAFADQTHASQKSNRLYFILPAIAFLALVGVIGCGYFFLKNKPRVISQTTLPPIEASKLIPYRKDNKWGYSDAQKRIYIEPKFYDAEPFSEDLALVRTEIFKYGYIDKTGNFVIQPNFDFMKYSMDSFSEGLAKVCEDKKCGFIDKSGNWAIQPKYYWADSFADGLAEVCFKAASNEASIFPSCGFIDKSGNEVIPLKYYSASSFSEGLAPVVDKTVADKKVIDGQTYYYGDTIFIDRAGKTVIKTDRRRGLSFSEGWAGLPDLSSTIYIDKSGKVALETKFNAGSFSEDLASVYQYFGSGPSITTKWGFIDKTGNLVIPVQYDTVGNFSEGLAMVGLDKKSGYIDKTGKIIIPLKYEDPIMGGDGIWNFKNGIAKVTLGDKSFYIGKDGTEFYEP